jgi:hypothetical protein
MTIKWFKPEDTVKCPFSCTYGAEGPNGDERAEGGIYHRCDAKPVVAINSGCGARCAKHAPKGFKRKAKRQADPAQHLVKSASVRGRWCDIEPLADDLRLVSIPCDTPEQAQALVDLLASTKPAKRWNKGDSVIKTTGDSRPTGIVLGTFTTTQGKERVVVELDFANLLHIYSPDQLEENR